VSHIYAPLHSVRHPTLDGLVLFELNDADGRPLHLAIRYLSFQNNQVDGDHLCVDGLEAAKAALEAHFDLSLRSGGRLL
jgi:hypothetical protein